MKQFSFSFLKVDFPFIPCQILISLKVIQKKKFQSCELLQELTFIDAVDSRILYCGFSI